MEYLISVGAHAAMSFLIPIGVVVYAAIGGLKATFTTSYMHMVIIFVLCLIFMFKVYVPGDILGGIDDVSSFCGASINTLCFLCSVTCTPIGSASAPSDASTHPSAHSLCQADSHFCLVAKPSEL